MKNKVTLPLFLLWAISAVFGQGFTASQIDSLVNRSMEMMPQVGLAVAVIENGKVIHSKGYGKLSVDSNEEVNEHSLFQIASNTKAFTAAALAILVDQGKLKWDDWVVQHIPEFTMYNAYVRENFTIVDLLTHRSGLGLGAGDLMFFPPGADYKIEDVLNSFQYFKPTSDFRTKYDYDNLLYIVAGEVIARVSGQTYDEFIEQHILGPLGMDRTAVRYKRLKSTQNVASAHSTENGNIRKVERYVKGEGPLVASGGIYSSVHDMSKWIMAQLQQGKYGEALDKQIFSSERQVEMWRPYTFISFQPRPEPGNRYHFGAYGLGWRISNRYDHTVISHAGGLPGMLSSVVMVPELNSAVVVLTNGAPGGNSYHTISSAIRDEWIRKDRWDYLASAKQQLESGQAEADATLDAVWESATISDVKKLGASSFLGTYEDKWFGKVSIENHGGKLWFRSLRSPQLNGEMFHYKDNTFAVKMAYTDMQCDAFAIFEMDASGNPIGIQMKGISPNMDFSFDYQDLDLVRIKE
ncbi:MAG: serine hydrolase [Flavobacteriaceae bacterium]|nr:serine hydrolase [Flavobacteriaceae bacterium]